MTRSEINKVIREAIDLYEGRHKRTPVKDAGIIVFKVRSTGESWVVVGTHSTVREIRRNHQAEYEHLGFIGLNHAGTNHTRKQLLKLYQEAIIELFLKFEKEMEIQPWLN